MAIAIAPMGDGENAVANHIMQHSSSSSPKKEKKYRWQVGPQIVPKPNEQVHKLPITKNEVQFISQTI